MFLQGALSPPQWYLASYFFYGSMKSSFISLVKCMEEKDTEHYNKVFIHAIEGTWRYDSQHEERQESALFHGILYSKY